MRSITTFFLFSAVCMAQEPAKPVETDKTTLQGEWIVIRVEALLEEVKDAKKARISIEGDKLIMSNAGKKDSYTLKLDSSKNPKIIDLYQDDKLISRSIYHLEKDELRLCFGLAHYSVGADGKDRKFTSAGDRPTAFDSRQGELFVLQRSKDK
jgi:uncharacterized protein (TIGR03067 family)